MLSEDNMIDHDNINLEFIDPEFHKGLNTTVRLGVKWRDKVDIGDNVWLVDAKASPSNAIVGNAVIKGIMTCPFMYISEGLLQHEHDSSCKTMAGLYRAMKRAYKDRFNEHSICTVLLFEVE